jgi:16S rRNA (cytosine967-C5)-methyltransferase
MTPSARLQAAIEILEALADTGKPADRYLRDWFRTRRYAGSKDRAAVAERVFGVMRKRAALSWRMQSEAPRALVIGSLEAEGLDGDVIAMLFDGSKYGPAPLDAGERTALSHHREETPPPWVRGEFPAFLEAELARSLGRTLLHEMGAMTARAPIDLRVNTLKAARDDVLAELRREGFAAEPAPYAPHGIRIKQHEGASALSRAQAFLEGRFEFQDEAAQIAALLCAAKPGERILDLAAGAGGKALALAAEMHNRGLIVASDNDPVRLAQLAPRAARAGVTIVHEQTASAAAGEKFDAVFVDAPCTGSGAWRRQPEQKWRLTPERLIELQSLQDEMLDEAARSAPARIVYATCSLLVCENEDRVTAFLARHPAYVARPAAGIWREVPNTALSSGMGHFFRATPLTTGTDGFFAAVLMRQR